MPDEKAYVTNGILVVPWRVSYVIELQTPDQIAALPDGTELRSIDGSVVIKGRDPIDLDTRAGRTAWGIEDRRALPWRSVSRHALATWEVP